MYQQEKKSYSNEKVTRNFQICTIYNFDFETFIRNYLDKFISVPIFLGSTMFAKKTSLRKSIVSLSKLNKFI